MFKKFLTFSFALCCLGLIGSLAKAQEREESLVMSNGNSLFSKWKVTFFSIASVPNMSYGKKATSDRSLESYNYFSLNYKLDSDNKIAVRIPFNYNSAGQNEYGDQVASVTDLQDVHIVYSKFDLGYIGDIDMSGNAKIYFPTSEASQNSRMITRLHFDVFFDYAISRFSTIRYAVKPDIYWQRQTAYFNPDTPQYEDGSFKKDPRSTTKQYALEQYVQAIIDLNKYFAVKPQVGFDEDWYYSSSIEALEGNH
ncbi:MAG: hypothetical protein ACXVCR_19630, partial [Bdellovibrio sp.]